MLLVHYRSFRSASEFPEADHSMKATVLPTLLYTASTSSGDCPDDTHECIHPQPRKALLNARFPETGAWSQCTRGSILHDRDVLIVNPC